MFSQWSPFDRKRKKVEKKIHLKDQVDQDEVDVHQDGGRLRPALQDPGPDPLPLEPHGTEGLRWSNHQRHSKLLLEIQVKRGLLGTT